MSSSKRGKKSNRSGRSSKSGHSSRSGLSSKTGSERSGGSGGSASKSGLSGDDSTGDRVKRSCSFKGSYKISGKKEMRERFLNDAKEEAARKKRQKQDMRSNGVKYKCEALIRFSRDSDFKVSATFLPSWDKGVPHVVLSENWEGTDRPMKPSIKKSYVKKWDNIQPFVLEEDEPSETGDPSTSGVGNLQKIIGSPNQPRPLALSKSKNRIQPDIKCTICNATYEKNTSKLWLFCGADGKRKCTKLAIHAECHFVVAQDQQDADLLCKNYIRCFDCRKKEKEEAKKRREDKRKKSNKAKESQQLGTASDDDFDF